jgi:flagellar hook protein FlgE
MSLFGSLSSGVSGLTSQASALGAISDNITNVSTIGYKNTRVNFQTLVTKQTSSTLYSPGGVQSRPRQDTSVQGLLQATSSQTDISISGAGFFVVNEASQPTISDQFLYTRSGSFFSDNAGFLRNTGGFFLQGWPTDAAGTVIPANEDLTIPNLNIVSTDFLESINLTQVGGTATATSAISIGANLPSNDSDGTTHRTDVQFFDSLGNANTMSVVYTRSSLQNNWDIGIEPPQNTSVLTIEDTTAPTATTFRSVGQLEFNQKDANGNLLRPFANVGGAPGATVTIELVDGTASAAKTYQFIDSGSGGAVTAGNIAVDVLNNTNLAEDVADLIAAVIANDVDFSTSNARIIQKPGVTTTILFQDNGTRAFSIDPTGLKDLNGTPVSEQRSSFTVEKPALEYQDSRKFTFPAVAANGDTVVINSLTYTFSTTEAVDATGADRVINIDAGLAASLADLEAAIEANDPNFGGTDVSVVDVGNTLGAANDTIILGSIPTISATGSYNVVFTGSLAIAGASTPTEPDGTAYSGDTIPVFTTHAIEFNADGLPKEISVKDVIIKDFSNGAFDMNDQPTGVSNNISNKIEFNFGTAFQADGMTQFGSSFTPIFISQNGSQFGTFAGVTIATDGKVTALFDNGETRIVYQIPLATFVNTSGLEGRSGNTWNATEASGDFTLGVADNGPSGAVIQAALEQSTVDIGEEFTKMIVVQRAFSAAAKIISTADEMLDELLRTKR